MLALAFAGAAVSPAAADPSPVPTGLIPGPSAVGIASAESGCPFQRYGYTGRVVCGYDITYINWGGGNLEYFVVGTDFSIWHIWLNSGGWHWLGGLASAFPPNGAYAYTGSWKGVSTYGVDVYRSLWCFDWPWTGGWYLC